MAAKKPTAAAAKAAAKEKEIVKAELVDEKDIPKGALEENPDGSVNAYDEKGEKAGTVDAETVKEVQEKAELTQGQQPDTKKDDVSVTIINKYDDLRLKRTVKAGEVLKVDAARAKQLIENKLAK